jgi:hypothetical protein
MDASTIVITVLSSVVCLFLGAFVNNSLRQRKAHDCPCDQLIKVTGRVDGLEKGQVQIATGLHELERSHNKLWALVEERLGKIETTLEFIKEKIK